MIVPDPRSPIPDPRSLSCIIEYMASASRTESALGQDTELSVPDSATGAVADEGIRVIPATPRQAISYRALLLFYIPLGFSGLMMTLDLPVVNAFLNRLPNPDT